MKQIKNATGPDRVSCHFTRSAEIPCPVAYKQIRHEFRVDIREDINQILLGSLLGDASLSLYSNSKNAAYCCSHSPKQKDYLFWKAKILTKLFKVNVTFRKNGPKHWLYRLRTNNSPILTSLHRLYYVHYTKPGRRWRKIINPAALSHLTPLGLAIWYCDDGTYYVRDKSCALSTQGFSYEENIMLKDYFSKKWGIPASVMRDHRSYINKTYYKLVFKKKETHKFLTLIKDFVPESMAYKLGHLSDQNLKALAKEDKRYRNLRKKWYYDNHEKALQRASRYRKKHRSLVNAKRVFYYWNNLERSRDAGKNSMRKRRLINKQSVNIINRDYYYRNRDKINKKRRERLLNDPAYRNRRNRLQREWYNNRKLSNGG